MLGVWHHFLIHPVRLCDALQAIRVTSRADPENIATQFLACDVPVQTERFS
jgi:hypothetical protein